MLRVKENYKYAVVVPSSMGLRLMPEGRQSISSAERFILQVTSAETNAASVCSYLGLPVKVLTAFIKNSPVSAMIKANLRSRNMELEGKELEQGGPWGFRHQINIADSGFGQRGPIVFNDRAGEVGKTLSIKDFDTDKLFSEEGVGILHLTGLICALSEETGELCLKLAEKAKENGTLVSFDFNHRESFWQGREASLRCVFREITKRSDIVFANKWDFEKCLGTEFPPIFSSEDYLTPKDFGKMAELVRREFPSVKLFASSLRETKSANRHLWGAVSESEGGLQYIEPREIEVLDRIGGGDAFAGGLLYGILKGKEPSERLQFGWASGAMAASVANDYISPVSEEEISDIWRGNARVKR